MNVKITGFLASLTVLAACAGDDSVDLGSGPIQQTRIGLVEFSGSWDGYAEGYTFRDGTDRVRLTLDANGNGGLEVGDSALRPVPGANDGYGGSMYELTDLNVGFSYPISGASVENNRLRAGADHLAFFVDYCKQLSPVAVFTGTGAPDGFACTGPGTTSSRVSCIFYCACDAQDCRVATREEATGKPAAADGHSVHLDAVLEDGAQTLVGTLVIDGLLPSMTSRITVRMNRN